jgi:hypothetical protein
MTVWIYVNTRKEVGDVEHLKVFANEDAACHQIPAGPLTLDVDQHLDESSNGDSLKGELDPAQIG